MTDAPSRLDVDTRHSRRIDAPPELVWRGLVDLDLRRSPVVRLLLALRGFRGRRPITLDAFVEAGFRPLERRPPSPEGEPGVLLLGLVAQPWRMRGGIHRGDIGDLGDFDEPGHAVISWSYRVVPVATGTELSTRTAVRCTDAAARARFMRYWRLVGPFSGIIRRESLRLVERRVEQLRESG